MSNLDLTGRVAIVTGAAGGIGREITRRYAEAGAKVVLAGRTAASLKKHAAVLAAAGGTTLVVPTDITEPDSVDALVARTVGEFGRLDIMVNNAGGGAAMKRPTEHPFEEWQRLIALNLTGCYLCCVAAGRQMIEQGEGGRIINISSIAGTKGNPGMLHYSAAKAGVISLTNNLALAWARENINVNCIAPGMVATEEMVNWGAIPSTTKDDGTEIPALQQTPKPEHVADLALFLASDASSMLTGELIPIRAFFHMDR